MNTEIRNSVSEFIGDRDVFTTVNFPIETKKFICLVTDVQRHISSTGKIGYQVTIVIDYTGKGVINTVLGCYGSTIERFIDCAKVVRNSESLSRIMEDTIGLAFEIPLYKNGNYINIGFLSDK